MDPSKPSSLPQWLQWVYQKFGTHVSLGEADFLYRTNSRIAWEDWNALCLAGDISALLAQLELEDHPFERAMFYTGSFHMTRYVRDDVALEIGRRYLDEFYREPFAFELGSKPDPKILKELALLYEYEAEFDLAIWV